MPTIKLFTEQKMYKSKIKEQLLTSTVIALISMIIVLIFSMIFQERRITKLENHLNNALIISLEDVIVELELNE